MNQITIPETYQLGSQTIKVELDNDLREDGDNLGAWYEVINTIKITSKAPRQKQELTYYHELVHSIFDLLGEDKLSNNDKLVDNIAMKLHQHDQTKSGDLFKEGKRECECPQCSVFNCEFLEKETDKCLYGEI